ncbi:MAG: NTP transferase domain-containing protein [Pseudomonadota bacterium]
MQASDRGTTGTLGLILAGGAGRRMGGAVKAALELGDTPLISRVAARLRPQCAALAVASGPDPARLHRLLPEDAIALEDPIAGYAGPLAGLLAGLTCAKDRGLQDVLSAAVDTPFFPMDLGARLFAHRGVAPVAIAATESGAHGTFGLWSVDVLPLLEDTLRAQAYKVMAFADKAGFRLVPFEGEPFFNINTPDDLAAAILKL